MLCDLLQYNPKTGQLIWKERGAEFFTKKSLHASWNKRCAGKPAFSSFNKGYLVGNFCGSNVSAHRVVWKMINGDEPDEIDHINGDRSDNRIENLRGCSRIENGRNLKSNKSNTSGAMGVSFHKSGKWRAYIKVNHKQIHLGIFDKKEDAINARKSAEVEYGFHKMHGKR